ncbi:augmenter of liver regeneration [Aspergillus cavernicola]|uniref:Sulfhydryl oxidase n=1 Tax=Aspergillus cavernicola TaxID=176166 RepID=A0ABR4J4U4_9EURO
METPSESQPQSHKTLFVHQYQTPTSATASSTSSPGSKNDDSGTTKLPSGVVLDKDGKPCRLCTSAASWRNLTKQAKAPTPTPTPAPAGQTTPKDSPLSTKRECPPDVDELGRSTWTLLHSMTATYPEKATSEQQTEMSSFLKLFSRLYPCWVCADDFKSWMAEPSGRNQPRLGGRADFGTWMCEAHNEVNRKLGKKEFDCQFWEERWRSGWKDGRCD